MKHRDDGHSIAIMVIIAAIVLSVMATLAREQAEKDAEVYLLPEKYSGVVFEAEACTLYNDPEIPDEIETAAVICAMYNGLDPELLEAVAWQESKYDPTAKSGSCMGCMQVHTKVHAKRLETMGVTKDQLLTPYIGMAVGASLLADHVRNSGSLEIALQNYNGSEHKKSYAKSVLNKRDELITKHSKGGK